MESPEKPPENNLFDELKAKSADDIKESVCEQDHYNESDFEDKKRGIVVETLQALHKALQKTFGYLHWVFLIIIGAMVIYSLLIIHLYICSILLNLSCEQKLKNIIVDIIYTGLVSTVSYLCGKTKK